MKLRKLNKNARLALWLIPILLMGCVAMAAVPALARYRVENKEAREIEIRPLEQIYLGKMVRSSDLAAGFEKEDISGQAAETTPTEETNPAEETTVPTEETQPTEESGSGEAPALTGVDLPGREAPQLIGTEPAETTEATRETEPSEPAETESVPGETEAEEAASGAKETEEMVFDQNTRAKWETVGDTSRLIFAVANGRVIRTLNPNTGTLVSMEEFALDDQRLNIQVVGNLAIWDGKEAFSLKLVAPSEDNPDQNAEYEATGTRIEPGTALHTSFGDGWIFTFHDEHGEPFVPTLKGGVFSVLELQLVLQGQLDADMGCLLLQITGDYTKK